MEIFTAGVEVLELEEEGRSHQAGVGDSQEVEVEGGVGIEEALEVVEEEVTLARTSFTVRRRASMTIWRDTMTDFRQNRLCRRRVVAGMEVVDGRDHTNTNPNTNTMVSRDLSLTINLQLMRIQMMWKLSAWTSQYDCTERTLRTG